MRKIISKILVTAILILTTNIGFANSMDYEKINQLIIGERLYRVTQRTDEHKNCFAENAIIRTSWQSGNVNSFVGQHPAENSTENFNVNRCGGALIHLNDSRAFVEYPSTTIRSVKVNGVDAILTSYMRILYRVEKISDEWKIIEMISINEADELHPTIPNQDLKINPNDIKNLRVSYRWLAYVRKNSGGEISDNLLGTDRPDEVKKVYDESFAWLKKFE